MREELLDIISIFFDLISRYVILIIYKALRSLSNFLKKYNFANYKILILS